MEVINVSADNYTDVENFLKSVPGIKIDVDVIMNASLLIKDEKIIGIISFECFGNTGLIRYFIFKQIIDEKTMKKLFDNLVTNANEKGINKIIALITNDDTIPIFSFLGFNKVDTKQVYIEEKKYINADKQLTSIYEYLLK